MSGPVTRSRTRNAIPAQPHATPEQPHQAQPVMPRAVTRSQTRNAIPEQSHQAHPGVRVSTDRTRQVPVPDITDFMSRRTSVVRKSMVDVMNMLLQKVKPTHVVKWASGQCTLEVRVRPRKQRQARNPQELEVQHPDPPDPQVNSETNRQEPVEGGQQQPAEGGQQQPESTHPEQPCLERQEVNSETIRQEPLQVGGLQQPESPHPDPPLTEPPPTVCDWDDDDDDDDDDRAYPSHFVLGESDRAYPSHFVLGESSAQAYPSHFVLGESSAQGANAVAEPGAGIIPGLPVQEANAGNEHGPGDTEINAAVNVGNNLGDPESTLREDNAGNESGPSNAGNNPAGNNRGETVSQPELVDQVEVELAKSVDTLMKQLKSKRVEFYGASLHYEIAVTEMLWVLLKEMPLKVSRVKMKTIQKSFKSRMVRNWSVSHDKMPDGEEVINDIVGLNVLDDWVLAKETRGKTTFVYFANKEDRERVTQSDVAVMEKIINDLGEASKKLKKHRSTPKQRKE